MLPIYEESENGITVYRQKSRHVSPHLHHSLEFVYVTEGELVLGIGEELFALKTGDFAVVFPDLVHHYQVFSGGKNRAIHILVSPSMVVRFRERLQGLCPANPVILKERLHPDILYAVKALEEEFKDTKQNRRRIAKAEKTEAKAEAEKTEARAEAEKTEAEKVKAEKTEKTEPKEGAAPRSFDTKAALAQAFVHILLARSLPEFTLVEKSAAEGQDLIYQTVSYIAAHFTENVTLTGMAHDLGVSPFALSRVFSSTFHRNFNRYLNETRLDYACTLLLYTDWSVTDICYDAGFESQRTFNRCFTEILRMTPREYRKRGSAVGSTD